MGFLRSIESRTGNAPRGAGGAARGSRGFFGEVQFSRVRDVGFRVLGVLGFRDLGFRVLGFRALGLSGFRVLGLLVPQYPTFKLLGFL